MINNNLMYKFYYEWWKNIDKSILFLIVLLFSLGLFFSLVSTSLIVSDKLNTNSGIVNWKSNNPNLVTAKYLSDIELMKAIMKKLILLNEQIKPEYY